MFVQKKPILLMLVIVMMITTVFIGPSSTSADTNNNDFCATCNKEGKDAYIPANTDQENKIIKIITQTEGETSSSFMLNNTESKREVLIVKDTPDLGFVLDKNTSDRSLSIYGVDLTAEAIFAHANFSFTSEDNGDQIFTISSSQKTQQFRITASGQLIDLSTNKEIDINDVELGEFLGTPVKDSGEVSIMASCREYVGTMCGLMSGYGMAELCALAALAGGLPGLGCAIIYAAIATWGCSSAMDLFC